MKLLIDSIFSFSYNKGEQMNDITYDGYELLYLISGSGTFIEDKKMSSYRDGDIFFSPPNYTRSIHCGAYTKYMCIRFQATSPITDLNAGLYHCDTPIFYELFESIFYEYKTKEYKYYELSTLKLQEIIIKLSRSLPSNASSNLNIHKLIKEIDTTLNFDMSVQEMANSLNYSYDHFRHAFKNITGQSPGTYITNKRIQSACELLSQNKHSCTEIAHMCGFSSSSQFSKLFKRQTGISPNTYQKHLMNDENEGDKLIFLVQNS